MSAPKLLARILRIERHEKGPRVFVLGRRVHEVELGFWILGLLAIGALTHRVHGDMATWIALFAALFFIAKDFRDLIPSQRDTGSWSLGFHRRVAPLREHRPLDLVPLLAGLITAVIGVFNLLSALTPNIRWRGRLLIQYGGIGHVPLFHALVLPAAATLLIAAFYLARRRRRACQLALVLLVALAALNLLKGLDFEEAAVDLAAAALLWFGRDSFHVHHAPVTLRSAAWRIPLLVVGVALLVAVVAAVAAPGRASLLMIVREAGDLLLWQQGPVRFHDELRSIPLAVELLSAGMLMTVAYLLFRPLAAPHSLPDPEVRKAAVDLVRSYGTDTLAFFKLRRDKHYLFTADRAAFVGYRTGRGTLVVSGDPVGPADRIPDIVQEAYRFASRRGLRLAVMGASAELVPVWEQVGLRSFYLGDEAVVSVPEFSLEGRPIRKVRQSISRLEKAGFAAELTAVGQLDPAALAELERVSEAWRGGAAERGFSMALDTLFDPDYADTLVLVARDETGAIRGFLHFVPSYGRSAMSLAFMRRDPDTPNGLTEFMVVQAILLLRERGVEELSLNFAAFARLLHSPQGRKERALGWLVGKLNPYFQIESLYRFNAKFFPRWESRYVLYEGVAGLPRAAFAIALLEGQLPQRKSRRNAA